MGLSLYVQSYPIQIRQTSYPFPQVAAMHQQEAIFQTARNLRQQHFGKKVFLYGFLYISTYCRNDCSFCFFRKSNRASQRYRKDEEEIVTAVYEALKLSK